MARTIVTQTLPADLLRRGMVATDGKRVFKIAKVVPMNLTGIVVKTESGVTVEPTYTHAQIVTRRGNLLNVKISDMFRVRAYVNL